MAAVVLENTFLSISAIVDVLMPFLTYVKPLVLRMDWNSAKGIQKIKQPILFIAGMQDELVPHSHMQQLRALATSSQRAVWYPVPGGTHNDSWLRGGDKYFSELRQFLEALGGDTTCLASDESSARTASPRGERHPGHVPAAAAQFAPEAQDGVKRERGGIELHNLTLLHTREPR